MVKCDICHFNNPDGFAYCGRCGNGLSSASNLSETFISSAIEGERKQVTIIFADISGFTALNDAANTPNEVEKVLQIVNHCLHMLSEVVHEYDGYIDKYMGDAIMAVFGAPRSHEDDPERALRTALAMRERLEEFNRNPPFPLAEPLGIHLGINTGTVIAGLIGTKRKRSYTVMGDAVNVASRLEGVSERGEVLVSQDTYHLTNRLFVFKDREPVTVKGKREPLIIYELVGARSQDATQRGIAGMRAPLVGRDKQFADLQRKISDLQAGQGGVITVIGEAGLGKSRLIAELYQQTARNDLHWLEGRGLSYRRSSSYRLFIGILHQYLDIGADEPGDVVWRKLQTIGPTLFGSRQDEVIPYLAALMGIKLDEKTAQNMPLSDPILLRQRMFLAVGEWVEAIVAGKPCVLVFEDLHWADSSSVPLIEYLLTITRSLPLLVICLTRPDKEIDFWSVRERTTEEYQDIYTEIWLNPLTQKQSRFLVDRLLQVEHLPDVLERLIYTRSEGNPLFMEEVLRSLIEDGTLVKDGDGWTMARPITEINIPETLTGVLTSRIDRLDEVVKRTLQIASVIGRTFHRSVLKGVADEITDDPTQLDQYLATLMAAELIKERPSDGEIEYKFKHILTYETTYNILLLQQRRIYHKRIADYMAPWYYLKGEEYANIVAHHYEQGEVWHRALTYLIRAAEASKTTFDNFNAAEFYTSALNISELVEDLKPETLKQIYQGRGMILKRLGKIDQARADFEQALELAQNTQDLSAQMRVLGELGQLRAGYGQVSQAAPYLEQALEIARQIEVKQGLVDALNQLGEFKFNMGQLKESSACYNEALGIARELNLTQYRASSQDGLAAVLLRQGEMPAAAERLEDIAKTWRDIGNYQGLMKTYVSLAAAYTWQADYANSDKVCADATELQERTGDLNWAPAFNYFLAYNAFAMGDWGATGSNLDTAIKISRQLGNGIWQSMALTQNGYYHLMLGQSDLALLQIQEAIQAAEATGFPLWISRARRALGVWHRLNRNWPLAQTILESELKRATRMSFTPDRVEALNQLLQVYMVADEWDKIPPLLQQMMSLAASSNMKADQVEGLVLSARLAYHSQNYEKELDLLLEAKNIAQQIKHKVLEIAIETAIITAQSKLNRLSRATTSLNRAEHLLDEIAATLDNDELRIGFLSSAPMISQLEQART